MPQARRSVSDGRSPKRLDQPGRSGRVLRSQAGVWGNIMNALASAYDALVRRKIRAADEALGWAAYPDVADPPSLDPLGHTAVFVVGSSRSGGVPALEWVRREFPGEFRNCIFMDVRTHGGTNQRRNVKIFLANSEPSTHGTSRHFAAPQQFGRFRNESDIERAYRQPNYKYTICLAPPACSSACRPPAIGLVLTISSAGSPSACSADGAGAAW
jgi:hypothetical protein